MVELTDATWGLTCTCYVEVRSYTVYLQNVLYAECIYISIRHQIYKKSHDLMLKLDLILYIFKMYNTHI